MGIDLEILKDFDNVDRFIILEKVSNPGTKIGEIAKMLNTARQVISTRYNKPEVKQAIETIIDENTKTALQSIQDKQIEAVEEIYDIMKNGEFENNRLKAACELVKNLLAHKIDIESSKMDEWITAFRSIEK